MNLKPAGSRQLPAYDEKQIEQLLYEAYGTAKFNFMSYNYPMNDNRLLLEYSINFFGNGDATRFFRKVYKKNGQWRLSDDFKAVNQSNEATSVDIDDIVSAYMGNF